MKKTLGIILSFFLLIALGTTAVFAEPTVVGTLNGAVGASGTWEGGYARETAGDSLKIYYQGDIYGYYFEDVPAGVYKIGFYITTESICFDKRMRVSPRVNVNGSELRCWIDWSTSDTLQKLSDALDDEKGKILFVSVIKVPADGALIDVGFWQNAGAYIGTLDKIVLASADYDFKDNEYVLIDEKSYGDSVFTEDPGSQLLAPEGSWTASTSFEDAVAELGPAATTEAPAGATPGTTPGTGDGAGDDATAVPGDGTGDNATTAPGSDGDATPAPTGAATNTPGSSSDTEEGFLPVWAIFAIVIVLAIAAGIGGAALSVKKKKQ